MSIQEKWSKFKQSERGGELLIVFIILGVGLGSFWLGRLSVTPPTARTSQNSASIVPAAISPQGASPRPEITVPQQQTDTIVTEPTLPTLPTATETPGRYVASKSGTKYHLPWCAGAKAIKESNKIWFNSKAEAEAAGYTPAANCKGI